MSAVSPVDPNHPDPAAAAAAQSQPTQPGQTTPGDQSQAVSAADGGAPQGVTTVPYAPDSFTLNGVSVTGTTGTQPAPGSGNPVGTVGGLGEDTVFLTGSTTPGGAPRRTILLDGSSPVPVSSTAGTSVQGDYAVRLSGGTWAANPAYAAHKAELDPRIARPDLLPDSAAYAQQLADGSTSVGAILGSAPTADTKAALGDAFELLGISNRQIGALTQAAIDGKIDAGGFSSASQDGKNALAGLGGAERVRAALDPYANNAIANPQKPVGDSASSFGVAGAIQTVKDTAAASGKFFSPDEVANDMLYGAPGYKAGNRVGGADAAFHNQAWFAGINHDYSADIGRGRTALASTNVDVSAPEGAVRSDIGKLFSDAPAGAFTQQSALTTIAAAAEIQGKIGPDAAQALLANRVGSAGSADEVDIDQHRAIAGALDKNGFSGLSGDQISARLGDAIDSDAFQSYLKTLPADQQDTTVREALGTLGFFNGNAAQAEVAAHDLDTDAGSGGTARKLLAQMAAQPPSAVVASASTQEKFAAVAGLVGNALSGLRLNNNGAGVIARGTTPLGEANANARLLGSLYTNPEFRADPIGYSTRLQSAITQTLANSGFPNPPISTEDAGRLLGVAQVAQRLQQTGVLSRTATDLFSAVANPVLAVGVLASRITRDAGQETAAGTAEQTTKIVGDAMSFFGATTKLADKIPEGWQIPKQAARYLGLGAVLQGLTDKAPDGSWAKTLYGGAASAFSNGDDIGNLLNGAVNIEAPIRSWATQNLTATAHVGNAFQLTQGVAQLYLATSKYGLDGALNRIPGVDTTHARATALIVAGLSSWLSGSLQFAAG